MPNHSNSLIKKITKTLFTMFLLFFPFRIDALLHADSINISGLQNIYQSHFITLSQILILLTIIALTLQSITNSDNQIQKKLEVKQIDKTTITIQIAIITLLIIHLFLSTNKINTAYNFIYITEAIAIYYIIKSKLLSSKKIKRTLLFSGTIISLIAITQFFKQSSIAHGLQYVGEPNISQTTLGIAKINIENLKIIRAYSTFQHPNILAAYLGTCLIYATNTKQNIIRNKYTKTAITTIIAFAFILTFSRSAYLAMSIIIILKLIKTKFTLSKQTIVTILLASILIITTPLATTSLTKRLTQNNTENINLRTTYTQNAIQIIKNNPITGVGLGNFTNIQPKITKTKIAPWENQPVHNTWLLLLSETGIPITILLIYLFTISTKTNINKETIIFILILSMFDHYFITNNQAIELLAITIALHLSHTHSKTPDNQRHFSQAAEHY